MKRKYEHVQEILRHPCSVDPLDPPQIVQAFQNFMVHVIPLAEWGVVATDPWRTIGRYLTWFFHVSHPVMIAPVEVVELLPPRFPNKEVIIEKYAGECPNTLQIMQNVYDIMKEALHDGDLHEYHQSMLRRIPDEMHPVTEL